MKKTYIKPEIEAIVIKSNVILCASYGISSTEFDNDAALARGGFDFDDDDDE